MLSAAVRWPRSSRIVRAIGTASTAAVSTFTPSRNRTSPHSAPALRSPRRVASRIIARPPSSEERVHLEEVLQPEHPARGPLGCRAPRHGVVVGPGVVAGIDVDRDLAVRIDVGGADLRPRIPEPRPAVLAVPRLVLDAAV